MAERITQTILYQNIHFVSRLPHNIPMFAKLGFKVDGMSVGSVNSSLDRVPETQAIQEFEDFMSEHQGEDWVMRAELVGYMGVTVEKKSEKIK